MKFTDGYWQMRPGVTPHFPAQVFDVEAGENELTVFAPTKRIVHRGDTLNLPLITVRFSSPMRDVIRVEILHHKGVRRRGPGFEIREDTATAVVIETDAEAASFTSGQCTARVERAGDWRIEFRARDRVLTRSGRRGIGVLDTPDGRFVHEDLSLGVGECVYGLGERFTAFVKNGQSVDIWNEDGGTASEQAYKSVPFYLTNRGYGVFVNHPERVSFEVASEKVECVQFSVPGERLEYFLIYGPSPKEVLSKYTALTGRPALPPAWSFGLWLSTSFTTDYDEETVTSFIQGMADRELPLHVFHFDCFWMKAFHWCDFTWDRDVFPDPEGMLKRLKARGLRICVWINPYIAQRAAIFDEAAEKGYLLMRPNGDVWQWDMWQAGMGIVDFTNSDARAWFAEKIVSLADMGVDCFKTDFGERIPPDVVYSDGSDPVAMHNYYSYLYNRTVFEALEERNGIGEAIVFARSATVGGQRFPVHWGGDCTATFESMAESLRGGLSLCLSGFGFWSHDIGGFEHTASADVYKRWCAFGLLSSHSRLHGSGSYRVPWQYDDEAVDVLRLFTNLKCRLMPYLFGSARHAHEGGIPMMRAMLLEFPEDPAVDFLDRQYMLGDALLVAPVFTPEGTVDYYLPEGRWTHFFTGETTDGGRWVREEHGFLSLPLMARPNSVIPVGANDQRPDYDYADGVTFHVFELDDGTATTVRIPSVKGDVAMTLEIRRDGRTLRIQASGAANRWAILLRGIGEVRSVAGGTSRADALGTLLTLDDSASALIVTL